MAAFLVATMIALPAAAADTNSATPDPAKVHEIADHLAVLEQQAAEVTRDADMVLSIGRNHQMSWESHGYYLGNLRDDVNNMGRMLGELEETKPEGSEAQQMAMERSRPHLEALASETRDALNLLRGGKENVMQAQYEETVTDLASQADILYQTLDSDRELPQRR